MRKLVTKPIKWILMFFFITLMISWNTGNNKGVQLFNLEKIAEQNANCTFVPTSEEFGKPILKIVPKKDLNGVVIWRKGDKQDWSKGNYLVFEIYGDNDYSGTIDIEFFKNTGKTEFEKIILQGGEASGTDKDKPWISCLMGILPRLKTKIVFPLSYLNAQKLSVPRFPRQLASVISGNRLDPNEITKVILRFGPFEYPYFLSEFKIAAITINENMPKPYPPIDKPIIDQFGQWKLKEWEGKIKDKNELIAQNLDLKKLAETAKLPYNWDKYGGWKEKRFKATGFFRTQNDGQRWWLVDPDGYAFLSVGVDCMSYGAPGPVDGIEDLFDWLPKSEDPQFSEAKDNRLGVKNMDFYKANLIRVYGKESKDKWSTVTAGLMKKYRLNTAGDWSDLNFAKKNNIPYFLPMRDFPSTHVMLYRDFPDVFSEEYKENSEKFAGQLIDFKDDPLLVGYFLCNEPQWAFGYHNLAYEMFGTNQQSSTKNKFIQWIKGKYQGNINAFNKAWKLKLNDFESLRSMTFKEYPSKSANDDFYLYSIIMVKKYVDIPCDEVSKIDKNHLNLGMRYAWISSDLLYKAGERFDVFSINGYGINPPTTEEISRKSGKPVMIGEFQFGAVDRGLPANGIIGVLNQEDRAKAYRNYIEQGFARPEVVGICYFQWIDEPFYGRFDGENYNIGIVDVNNRPYSKLTNAMTITNERIYKVGSGLVNPFKYEVTKIASIYY
jgi:hypothetical protein